MAAAPPSDTHTKLSSVLNQLSLDKDADTSLLHSKSTLISATVNSNSTVITTDDANNTTIPAHNSCLRDTDIVDELSVYHTYDIKDTSAVKIDWDWILVEVGLAPRFAGRPAHPLPHFLSCHSLTFMELIVVFSNKSVLVDGVVVLHFY